MRIVTNRNDFDDNSEDLSNIPTDPVTSNKMNIMEAAASIAPTPSGYNDRNLDICQWEVCPNGVYRPAARTIPSIPAGAYSVDSDNYGVYLRTKPTLTDSLTELPDCAATHAMNSIRKFWKSKAIYSKHGLLYKRGCILYGPAGSGKSAQIQILTAELIKADGIVIFCDHPQLTVKLLEKLRTIEPERALIVVFEDIDELIGKFGEHDILALLDGEHQVANCTFLATTNYASRLGGRIINRPSRFDERIFVGMPGIQTRLAYLQKVAGTESGIDLHQWAEATDGLSIAHLRELMVAVLCLEQDYTEVLSRLKSMRERIKEDDEGYKVRQIGLVTR